MNLVFAYGSNLRVQQMLERCPGAEIVGVAVLPDYRLVFAGHSPSWRGPVASVVRSRGRRVPGVIYQLNDLDMARLDRFEGHPAVYRRVRLQVLANDGWHHVQVYRMDAPALAGPTAPYFAAVMDGYRSWGFDLQVLAVAAGWSRKASSKPQERAGDKPGRRPRGTPSKRNSGPAAPSGEGSGQLC